MICLLPLDVLEKVFNWLSIHNVIMMTKVSRQFHYMSGFKSINLSDTLNLRVIKSTYKLRIWLQMRNEVNMQIRKLNIAGNHLDFSELKLILKMMPKLKKLDLSRNKIITNSIYTIAPELIKLTKLEAINLSCNNICINGLAILAPVVSELTCLTELNLARNAIGMSSISTLEPALIKLTRLRSLNLDAMPIGIVEYEMPMRTIDLSFFTKLTHLRELNLSFNLIGSISISTLNFLYLTKLKSLDISWNYIRGSGAITITPTISRLTKLTKLNLACNNIGSNALSSDLVSALIMMTKLTVLDLSWNSIRAKGATALAPVLNKLTQLSELYISCNSIGSNGATALLPALNNLECLNLSWNKIKNIDEIENALTHIQFLDITHNGQNLL
jgi:Ran GTPase-activating protein (RanGAP) involved in mRNA processing and transport